MFSSTFAATLAIVMIKVTALNLDSFSIDYGAGNISKNKNDLEIKLDASASGGRISAPSAFKGQVCSTISLTPTAGAAFAMYASSGEPNDRSKEKWDELDFEFPGGLDPGSVWFNVFKDGNDDATSHGFPIPSSSGPGGSSTSVSGKRYCLSWDIKASRNAVWSVDGKVVKAIKLDGWTKPLKPYFSYWGIAMNAPNPPPIFLRFLGGERKEAATLVAVAKKVEYSMEFNELVVPADAYVNLSPTTPTFTSASRSGSATGQSGRGTATSSPTPSPTAPPPSPIASSAPSPIASSAPSPIAFSATSTTTSVPAITSTTTTLSTSTSALYEAPANYESSSSSNGSAPMTDAAVYTSFADGMCATASVFVMSVVVGALMIA